MPSLLVVVWPSHIEPIAVIIIRGDALPAFQKLVQEGAADETEEPS